MGVPPPGECNADNTGDRQAAVGYAYPITNLVVPHNVLKPSYNEHEDYARSLC